MKLRQVKFITKPISTTGHAVTQMDSPVLSFFLESSSPSFSLSAFHLKFHSAFHSAFHSSFHSISQSVFHSLAFFSFEFVFQQKTKLTNLATDVTLAKFSRLSVAQHRTIFRFIQSEIIQLKQRSVEEDSDLDRALASN